MRGAHLLAAFALVLVAGCGHVALTVPARDASYPVRAEAFQLLRPVSRDVEVVFNPSRNIKIERSTRSVLLGNEEVVRHPVDLLPAVLPTSLTATRILALQAHEAAWNVWGAVALGAVGTGVTPLLAGLVVPKSANPTFEYSALLASVGVSVVALVLGGLMVGETGAERARCFESYEADLREYLNVGTVETRLAPSPGAAPLEDGRQP